MSKLLVIFGITGNQGGSIADFVLRDPDLSTQYKIRGVTRDPSKPAALELVAKGIEIVAGDLNDTQSIKKAVEGAHTVFAITFSSKLPPHLPCSCSHTRAQARVVASRKRRSFKGKQ